MIGTVVLTHYNNNTYRIEDVDFSTTPASSFPLKNGDKITYIDYYKKKYGIVIKNQRQPMLVTKSKTRDRQAAEAERVYLVPELCRATGASLHYLVSNFTEIYIYYYISEFNGNDVAFLL